MTVELRNPPHVIVNNDREVMTFGREQLAEFDEHGELIRTGHRPNVGDVIVGTDGKGNLIKEEVVIVDFTTQRWKTKRLAWESDQPADMPLDGMPYQTIDLITPGIGTEAYMSDTPEPGLRAKARLAARRAARRTAKIIRWVVGSGLVLAMVCAIIIVTYGYKTMETGRDSFDRTCSVRLSNGMEVTGKRSYLQKFQQVFGFKFSNTRDAYEKTTLDVRSNALTVIGQYTKARPINPEDGSTPAPEERWWGMQMESGDKEKLVLKGADNYTFVMGKGIAVVKYDEFCKG